MSIAISSSESQPYWSQDRVRSNLATGLELTGLFLAKPAHEISKPLIRVFATPIRPGIEGNFSSGALERIWRLFVAVIGVVSAPVTVGLALVGATLGKIADVVRQKSFTYFKGFAPEKGEGGASRLMTLNACMLWGGLPIPLGGMRPPSSRMDMMAKELLKQDPDVLVMQEMAFDSAFSLYQRLKGSYAHFFTRIGPNPPLMESGLFVASKYRVLRSGFIPFPNQLGIYRGAFWIETPKSYVVTTHMEFGDTEEGKNKRKEQFGLILQEVEKFKHDKPCFLLGDFNLDRSIGNNYEEMGVGKHFHDPYFKKHPRLDEASSTCTDVITAHTLGNPLPKKRWEMIDYALLAKGPHDGLNLKVDQVPMYDNEKPYQALSDHCGLVLTATT